MLKDIPNKAASKGVVHVLCIAGVLLVEDFLPPHMLLEDVVRVFFVFSSFRTFRIPCLRTWF